MMLNHIFVENDNQEKLYNTFGEKLLKDIFRGYNGTIMAYGKLVQVKHILCLGDLFLKILVLLIRELMNLKKE